MTTAGPAKFWQLGTEKRKKAREQKRKKGKNTVRSSYKFAS